jgi:hypothetical protein
LLGSPQLATDSREATESEVWATASATASVMPAVPAVVLASSTIFVSRPQPLTLVSSGTIGIVVWTLRTDVLSRKFVIGGGKNTCALVSSRYLSDECLLAVVSAKTRPQAPRCRLRCRNISPTAEVMMCRPRVEGEKPYAHCAHKGQVCLKDRNG